MKSIFLEFSKFATLFAALIVLTAFAWSFPNHHAEMRGAQSAARPEIQTINPPEDGFFTKLLSFHGVLIKAPSVVVDEALYITYDRMAIETAHLPMVVTNLAAAGAELHIIGRDQVTTDLPEWRQDKHVPLDEYNGLTRDQRTRGMGGLITSCGEENLLKLPTDRYHGRDICMHEFAHNIEGAGIPRTVRSMFDAQYQISKSKGLWLNSYAGSNPNEYFAELTMWYFGTHGDLNMTGPKPEDGPEGLKKYDPDAYKLLDDFYSGKIEIAQVEPRPRAGMNGAPRRTPRDSLLARAIVAHLTAYKVGETKLTEFFSDAGMQSPSDAGTNGWHVITDDSANANAAPSAGTPASTAGASATTSELHFRIFFRNPESAAAAQPAPSSATNPSQQSATNNVPPRPRSGGDRLIADLEFKAGILTAFKWDN
jgi:hypothetical protein